MDVQSWTGNTTIANYDDGLDNQIIYYRIGIKSGEYTSGTADVALEFSGGSLTGTVRITAVTDAQNANAQVIQNLGGTDATDIWAEGAWSERRGYPSSVALYEGRLWWAGKDKVYGSITDAFESFDDEFEGDAGPITRSIGSGPVDVINWLLPMQRLILGTEGAESSAKSSSFDEPLTPSNFNIKDVSTQGSAKIEALKVDTEGLFVQRSGIRVYQLQYNPDFFDYASVDITSLVPEVCEPSVKRLVLQRQPDTRVHCVLTDGTVAVLITDRAENVKCWIKLQTEGQVEDVCVLPGTAEDQVYYVVNRTGGRYIEKWALESECRGGTLNRCMDSYIEHTGLASVYSGLDHLEGKTVVGWGDGKDLGSGIVFGGKVELAQSSSAVIGLPYDADWKSTKIRYDMPHEHKRISNIGFVLLDTHKAGLKYGTDFDRLSSLPDYETGPTDPDKVWADYHFDDMNFGGTWDPDARLCLRASAPRPCTVLAANIDLD